MILPTEYAAVRALGRCRMALNYTRFDPRLLYTFDIAAGELRVWVCACVCVVRAGGDL